MSTAGDKNGKKTRGGENEIATNLSHTISRALLLLLQTSIILSFCLALLLLCDVHSFPFSRSCFEFLGFTAHITFISVQKTAS